VAVKVLVSQDERMQTDFEREVRMLRCAAAAVDLCAAG
jgi:hypothetical protein